MFGCHPVHVEPVLSVVGRADLLYTSLFLASALINIHWSPTSSGKLITKYSLLAVISGISMLCKEQGILFIVFLLLTQLAQTGFRKEKLFTRNFVVFSLYIGTTLTFLATVRMAVMNFQTPTFQKHDNPAAFIENVSERILNFNYIYLMNIIILIYPYWLCFDWAMQCLSSVTFSNLGSISLLIAFWITVAGLAFKAIKCQKLEFLAFSLLIVPFALSMNVVVYVGFVIGERNLYLSVAGISLFTCKGFIRLQSRHNLYINRTLSMLMLIMLTSFSAKSYSRSLEWRTELELFQSGLKVCYNNAKVHYNVAKKLADNNQVETAVVCYKESIRLQPDYEHAFNNLGNLMKMRKQFSEAETLLSRATQINPKFAAAFMNLGIVQMSRGKLDTAEESYQRALNLRHVYPDCEYNLANLYLKQRKLKLAETRFRLATEHKHELAFLNLIILLDEQSKLNQAEEVVIEARKYFPSNPEFVFQQANILGQLKKFEESEELYLLAISMKNSALYWSNLGVLYHLWNKTDKAIQAYNTALEIDSSHPSARVNRDRLLKRKL